MRPSNPTHHAQLGNAILNAARDLAAIAERAASLGLTPPALLTALEPELRHWATTLLAATQPAPADAPAGTSLVAIVTVVEVDTPGISLDVLAEAITRGRPDNGALLLAHSTPGIPTQAARWRIRHTTPRALPPHTPNPHHRGPRSGPDRGVYQSPVIADPALLRAAAVQRLTTGQPPAPASEETGQ